MKRTRVLIADDQPIFVEGVRRVLEPVADIEVVGSAESEAKVLPATRDCAVSSQPRSAR